MQKSALKSEILFKIPVFVRAIILDSTWPVIRSLLSNAIRGYFLFIFYLHINLSGEKMLYPVLKGAFSDVLNSAALKYFSEDKSPHSHFLTLLSSSANISRLVSSQ